MLDYDIFSLGSTLIKIHIVNVNVHEVIRFENGEIYLIDLILIARISPQGLVDHWYTLAFGKKACIYHMATYDYNYQMYDGKTDLKQISQIFSPKTSMRCFKEVTVNR